MMQEYVKLKSIYIMFHEFTFSRKEVELLIKAINFRQSEWFNSVEEYNLIQIKIELENELRTE